MAFFVKITPPLTFSSSVALAGFVVNVVSVVSRICILPKNRYLFLPSRKHVFRPLGSLVSIISKSRCPSSNSSFFLSKSSPILPDSRVRPLPSSQSPLPSSPIPVPVLSHPPPPSQRKQRNDTKPSRRSLWLVPKWNIVSSYQFRKVCQIIH